MKKKNNSFPNKCFFASSNPLKDILHVSNIVMYWNYEYGWNHDWSLALTSLNNNCTGVGKQKKKSSTKKGRKEEEYFFLFQQIFTYIYKLKFCLLRLRKIPPKNLQSFKLTIIFVTGMNVSGSGRKRYTCMQVSKISDICLFKIEQA